MMTSKERAEYQTRQVELWLLNDEPSYLAACAFNARTKRMRRKFTASRAKRFVYNLWGDRNPHDEGMSKVRWSEVSQLLSTIDQ